MGFIATLTRATDGDPELLGDVYIVAFRGTATKPEWSQNFKQVIGFRASQFDQAIQLAGDVMESLPEGTTLIVTGHSKGGAQAVAAAYATGTRGRFQSFFTERGMPSGCARPHEDAHHTWRPFEHSAHNSERPGWDGPAVDARPPLRLRGNHRASPSLHMDAQSRQPP